MHSHINIVDGRVTHVNDIWQKLKPYNQEKSSHMMLLMSFTRLKHKCKIKWRDWCEFGSSGLQHFWKSIFRFAFRLIFLWYGSYPAVLSSPHLQLLHFWRSFRAYLSQTNQQGLIPIFWGFHFDGQLNGTVQSQRGLCGSDSKHPFNWVDLTWVNHFDKYAH